MSFVLETGTWWSALDVIYLMSRSSIS